VVFAASNRVQIRGINLVGFAHVEVVDGEFSTFGHAGSVVGIKVSSGRESTDIAKSTAERLACSTALFHTSVVGSMPVRLRADEGLVSSDVSTTSSEGSTAFNRVTSGDLSSKSDELTRSVNIGSNIGDALRTISVSVFFAEISSFEGEGRRRIEEVAVEIIDITTVESSLRCTTSWSSVRAVNKAHGFVHCDGLHLESSIKMVSAAAQGITSGLRDVARSPQSTKNHANLSSSRATNRSVDFGASTVHATAIQFTVSGILGIRASQETREGDNEQSSSHD